MSQGWRLVRVAACRVGCPLVCRPRGGAIEQHTGVTDAQMTLKTGWTPACSSTPPPPRCTSQDPKTRASVTSTLQRGVISILRLQAKVAVRELCKMDSLAAVGAGRSMTEETRPIHD